MMKSLTLVALSILLPSALAAEYLVGVGKDETTGKKGIGFDPSVIHPIAGDVIAFEFRSGAHSVVQTTFETPCVPLEGGYNTGVFRVDDSLSVDAPGLPSVRLAVNDTDPLWFFDQAGGLCQQGAVLAVNPSTTQTAAQFRENAAKSPVAPMTTDTPSATSTADSASASTTGNTGNGGSNDASALTVGILTLGLSAALRMFIAFV